MGSKSYVLCDLKTPPEPANNKIIFHGAQTKSGPHDPWLITVLYGLQGGQPTTCCFVRWSTTKGLPGAMSEEKQMNCFRNQLANVVLGFAY